MALDPVRRVLAGASLPLLLACPPGGGGPGADGGDAGSTTEETEGETEGQCTESPVEAEGDSALGSFATSVETLPMFARGAICPDAEFPELFEVGEPFIEGLLYYPASGEDSGVWASGSFPLLVFSHGNGQAGSHYDLLMRQIASRGIVAVSILSADQSTSERRGERIHCMARQLTDPSAAWSGNGRLNGQIVFGGHSTGGEGAMTGAVHAALTGVVTDVVAVATIAPACNTLSLPFPGPSAPGFFALQGSRDGDTDSCAFVLYDRAAYEDPQDGEAQVGKVLVWAYDVEHSEYGGA